MLSTAGTLSLPVWSNHGRLARDSTDPQTRNAVRIRRTERRPFEIAQSSAVGIETTEAESKVVIECVRTYCGLRCV